MRSRRRKAPAIEERPEIAVHLHDDDEINRERLSAFAQAAPDEQLLVLGQLRIRSEDQQASLLPAIQAMALAILALLVSLVPLSTRFAVQSAPIDDPLVRWISDFAGLIIFVIITLVLALSTMWAVLRADLKRARAAAWHEAYERELSRRRNLPGRAGTRWRRTHPV